MEVPRSTRFRESTLSDRWLGKPPWAYWIGALLSAVCGGSGASYPDAVLAQRPAAYWRLNEEVSLPPADIAHNLGSLGTAADGYYGKASVHPVAGALLGVSDTAASFNGFSGSYVSVPMSPGLEVEGPFTVEFWTRPRTAVPESFVGSPLASQRRVLPDASGWIFYQASTGWYFRMGNREGYQLILLSATLPVPGVWHHLAAVYDGVVARLYVNGVEEGSGPPAAIYEPNPVVPLGVGARGDNGVHYDGAVDEVAIYPQALSAAEIQSRYENGTNASPATPYSQLVLAQAPIAYWRLDEPVYAVPTELPAAQNLGSLGGAADGSYQPGLAVAMAGPRAPSLGGFEPGNTAIELNGSAGGVATPYQLNDLREFTVVGWIRRGEIPSVSGSIFSQTHFFQVSEEDSAIRVRMRLDAPTDYPPRLDFSFAYPFAEGAWGMLAMVGDSTQVAVYTNGLLAKTVAQATTNYGRSDFTLQLGWGGLFNRELDHFRGGIDEVAVFERALTPQEILGMYQAAGVVWLTIRPLDGQLEIQWPRGVLEESPTIPGSWSAVSGASPPVYLAPLSAAGSRFYRVVAP